MSLLFSFSVHFRSPNYRSRKASITTGIVERSEPVKSEALDRLSPLTSSSIPFLTVPASIDDPVVDLEKFVDNEMETTPTQQVS